MFPRLYYPDQTDKFGALFRTIYLSQFLKKVSRDVISLNELLSVFAYFGTPNILVPPLQNSMFVFSCEIMFAYVICCQIHDLLWCSTAFNWRVRTVKDHSSALEVFDALESVRGMFEAIV